MPRFMGYSSMLPDMPEPQPSESLSDQPIDFEAVLRSLRRKEGTWVEWGQACQQLQKGGYTAQQIFEETGFEPAQQNQITVATQVYQSILLGDVPEDVRSRFERTGSDTLYELRILNQDERAAAAQLIVEKGIDSEGARDVAKALKSFSRLAAPPEEFSTYPGDAVAYDYWKLARQQLDLSMRSRLIAAALRFASSDTARRAIEKLLTDLTVTHSVTAPRLPVYRLDAETEVPKILPVVGRLPLTVADLQAAPLVEEEEPFGIVRFAGEGAWVSIPGWQVVLSAEDPVVILADSDRLPTASSRSETLLVMVDRAQRQWDALSYFVVEQADQLDFQWFEAKPEMTILGKILLVMLPKKVLDEEYNKELWQIDE